MDRRSLLGLLAAAGAAGPGLQRAAVAQPVPKVVVVSGGEHVHEADRAFYYAGMERER